MRKEPFTVGNYVHVLKRGVRKMPITRDTSDMWRFLKTLCHLNDEYRNDNWERDLENSKNIFARPESWPEPKPLVSILAYCLMPNHFHLILREINPGGVSKFMQKQGMSMNKHFNQKYEEVGSMFQGAYKSRTILDDMYLRYLAVYVMVKNPFELEQGGISEAMKNFDTAYDRAVHYKFSSLGDYVAGRNSPFIQKDILGEIFTSPTEFKAFAYDVMSGRASNEHLGVVSLE